jgi:hypothetical protein
MATKNSARRAQVPAGFLANAAALALALKREIAVLAGLVLVAAVALTIYGAVRTEPEPPLLQAEPLPLTDQGIQDWVSTTSALAAAKAAGKLDLQSRTLPDFLEWMRTRREVLLDVVPDLDAEAYAGLTASVHRARTWERKLYEFEALAKSEEQAWKRVQDSGAEFRFTPPPPLEQQEWDDLRLYESQWNLVETTLLALMPSIQLPIPAPAEEVKEGEEGAPPKPEAKPIRWRAINASRYGPRVVKTP